MLTTSVLRPAPKFVPDDTTYNRCDRDRKEEEGQIRKDDGREEVLSGCRGRSDHRFAKEKLG